MKEIVAGLMIAFAMSAVAKPDGGWFTVVSWNVGHHAMGSGRRPTIPLGKDDR